MARSAATRATGQTIQLRLRRGCKSTCFFMSYMDPLYLAVTVTNCIIYLIQTIPRDSIYSLNSGFRQHFDQLFGHFFCHFFAFYRVIPIGQTNLMPTRNKLISKNLQKVSAFEVYFISEIAETLAK